MTEVVVVLNLSLNQPDGVHAFILGMTCGAKSLNEEAASAWHYPQQPGKR